MRKLFSKFALAAGISLALAFTYSYASASSAGSPSGESYAAEHGCRWNYQLQQGLVLPNEFGKNIRANAAAESRSNPNCAEVIYEAVQRENGNSELSGESYASARGCRWNYQLQQGLVLPNEFGENVRANAAVESLQYNNCAEVIREAKRRENR